MEIVKFPHPTLRHKSKTIKRVDQELKNMVGAMFELMYEARGIGLAANQVDLPLRLFIINTTGDPKTGEELVFVNPVVDSPKGKDDAEEGCLSLPGVNGVVARPEQIHVSAYDLQGNEVDLVAKGLLARAIQHEYDHIEGVMFIDRMKETELKQIEADIDAFEIEFQAHRETKKIPSDDEIAERLKELETRYC